MSATPETLAEDMVTVEIDGRSYQARKGAMIIEVTDAAGIEVPRFCYHPKLPIAANCRMCLVQVEKVPKPLPACATPVADGMKIYTCSDFARKAQKAVMEFLLINHPLDCPICDQGGECELQDLALGYGRDVSRFAEKKRVVKDKDLGPLIATDMTRCIHCTRCIRFLEVIAGSRELGGVGRGENMEISTYVAHAIESELSGNIIDVCPVGALTSKPFRFQARAWEMTQHAAVAPHDSVGSNLFLHVRRGEVMRVVPRDNEAINEVWISDRDRFSYQALAADDRLTVPQVKLNGRWREVEWEDALQAAAHGLRTVTEQGGDGLGVLVSPTATLEEMFLLERIAAGLGCANIDHRLRQVDFTGDAQDPSFPWLGTSIEALESADQVLLVGSNIRHEQPILAHRLRKAALAGGSIHCINPIDYDFHFPVANRIVAAPPALAGELAALAATLADTGGGEVPEALREQVAAAEVGEVHRAIAAALKSGQRAVVLLGSSGFMHPAFSRLRALAAWIAQAAGATFGFLPEAANSAGAWLAGATPHRAAGGGPRPERGRDVSAMLREPRKGYLLFNVEPEFDCADPRLATQAVQAAEFVCAITPFDNDVLRETADVLLPAAAFAETSGTFVNLEGRWQGFGGAVQPPGEARPGWKILRVLGNMLGIGEMDYTAPDQVRDALRALAGEAAPDNRIGAGPVATVEVGEGLARVGDVPIYRADPVVRRAPALQASPLGGDAVARVNGREAARLGLSEAKAVEVWQDDAVAVVGLEIDERVPNGAVWLPSACSTTRVLGAAFGRVQLKPAG